MEKIKYVGFDMDHTLAGMATALLILVASAAAFISQWVNFFIPNFSAHAC